MNCTSSWRPKDSAGDGMVPVHSGEAPASAGSTVTYHVDLSSEGHEGAYRVDLAKRITLHSILRVVQAESRLE